jgi:hypothetical protein
MFLTALFLSGLAVAQIFPDGFSFNPQSAVGGGSRNAVLRDTKALQRDTFLNSLVANLTVPELGTYSFLYVNHIEVQQ